MLGLVLYGFYKIKSSKISRIPSFLFIEEQAYSNIQKLENIACEDAQISKDRLLKTKRLLSFVLRLLI